MHIFDSITRFKVLQTEKGCPLTPNERLVYSHLVYRYCLIKSHRLYWTTALQIGAATGLDRRATVPAALKALAGHGLAEKKGRGWYARQPEGPAVGWFRCLSHFKARNCGWYDRFAYNWHPVPGPACPLTPRQLYLYGLYVSLLGQNKRNLADKYVAMISGLDPATVRTAREKLLATGLLVDGQYGWACPEPDPATGWFRPVGQDSVVAAGSAVPGAKPEAHRADAPPAPGPGSGGAFGTGVGPLVPLDFGSRRPDTEYDPGRRLAERGYSESEVMGCLMRHKSDLIRQVDEAHPEPLTPFALSQRCADARIAQEPWATAGGPISRPATERASAGAGTGATSPPPTRPVADAPAASVARRGFEEEELITLRSLLKTVREQLRHEAWGEEPDDVFAVTDTPPVLAA